jgi:hypothetical protein
LGLFLALLRQLRISRRHESTLCWPRYVVRRHHFPCRVVANAQLTGRSAPDANAISSIVQSSHCFCVPTDAHFGSDKRSTRCSCSSG